MTLILLIRHGQNNLVGKSLAGRMPGVHLNERGQQQAQALATALLHAPIKAIYSSPMERAQETAAPLAQAHGLVVEIEPGLNEVDIGEWQGRSLKQLSRLNAWKTVQKQPSAFRFPQGETFAEAQARGVAALQAIAARHPEDVVACFSHADVIRLVTAYFLDVPLDSFQRIGADTASIAMLSIGKEGQVGVWRFNQVLDFSWPEPKKKRKPRARAEKPMDEQAPEPVKKDEPPV